MHNSIIQRFHTITKIAFNCHGMHIRANVSPFILLGSCVGIKEDADTTPADKGYNTIFRLSPDQHQWLVYTCTCLLTANPPHLFKSSWRQHASPLFEMTFSSDHYKQHTKACIMSLKATIHISRQMSQTELRLSLLNNWYSLSSPLNLSFKAKFLVPIYGLLETIGFKLCGGSSVRRHSEPSRRIWGRSAQWNEQKKSLRRLIDDW